MNEDHLCDPSSYIHQAALEQVTKLWPFTVQLVTVYPRLANEMRAALRMPERDSREASDDGAPTDAQSAPPTATAPGPLVAPPRKPSLSPVDSVLVAMQDHGLSIGAFLRLLFARPSTSLRSRTHISMLNAFLQARCKDRAEHIVDLIYTHPESAPRPTRGLSRAALNPKDGTEWARARIFDWASQVVVDAVHVEVGRLVDPKTSRLRPPKHFTWDSLHATRDGYFLSAVRESSPLLLRILLAACMSSSTERDSTLPGAEGRGKKQRQPEMVAVSAALMLAATRAPRANLFQRVVGIWLWSVCAPAALFSILCRLGLSVAYSSVLRLLRELAATGMADLHLLLMTCLFIVIYDNINRRHQVWQAKLGQVWEQLNGTAPFVLVVPEWDEEIFDPAPVERAIREKRRLALTPDKLRSAIDYTHQRRVMAHHVLLFLCSWVARLSCHKERIYDAFRTSLAKHRLPEGRKTELYPLGTSALNEATTAGTKDVIDDIFKDQLGLDPDVVAQCLRIVGGDQLTVARLRSLKTYMASCPHGYPALRWVLPLVLLWHMGWADLARDICTHYGGKVAGDPSTFKHVNVLLKRRVKDEDRPDFYPALKLLSESLKADVLDCWMLELETESLASYFDTHYLSYEELECHAYRIVDQYFNLGAAESAELGIGTPLTKFKLGDPWHTHTEPGVEQRLPTGAAATVTAAAATVETAATALDDPMDLSLDGEHAEPGTTIPSGFQGDQTLANGIRRRNDSMLQYEFQFAISDGDFGRAWEVMLAWISRFAGSGHTKYVDELLELFCNFNYEYPAPLTKAIWDNSLGSLTGNPGSYVPLDLLQEWMIGEIKSHMSRSDEAFDSAFVRKVVTPNIRGAQELKKTVRQLFGLAKPSIHRDDGLDDASVARLLRDARSTQANRFRRGRHYGHVARDDDAKGQEELEKGKVQAFLRRTTADAQTCLTSADVDEQEAEPSSADNSPPADLSMLVDGVFRATMYEDADVWDGFEDADKSE